MHELRNSPGAIRTALELLQRRYRPDGRAQRLSDMILTEVDRLSEIAGSPPSRKRGSTV